MFTARNGPFLKGLCISWNFDGKNVVENLRKKLSSATS